MSQKHRHGIFMKIQDSNKLLLPDKLLIAAGIHLAGKMLHDSVVMRGDE